jgi:NAD(P)-dependent dehydrogenase (short-subunit alcohol dehydrogenase family)
VIPEPSLSIRAGAIAPWRSSMERGEGWTYRIIDAMAKACAVNLYTPFAKLPKKKRDQVLYGLGDKRIRVHPISPGPLKTRAASALKDFDLLLNEAASRAPVGELVDIDDVGYTCAYLATPYARRLTGQTMYVDGGVNIMG